jgi:prophage maintenance system killer protein
VSEDVLYLDADDILHLHARIFGINPDAARDRLRDSRTLESAIARPINHATYEDADLAGQAAILAYGIAQR